MLKARKYQSQNIKEILEKLKHHHRCLYVAPTGAGKTTTSALLASEAVKAGRPVRFYVHRDKLVEQTVKTFDKVGLSCGIVAGGYKYHKGCPVQVVSVQTISSGKRDFGWLDWGDRKPLTLADECHITQYYDVMQSLFPMLPCDRTVEDEGFLVGLTGTPWRLSRDESLGQFYPQLVKAPGYRELIDMGYLVQPVYYQIPNAPTGDMIGDIEYCIRQWKDKAQSSPTFLFTSSVEFAEKASEKFNQAGISAAVVTGKTPRKQRDRIFTAFENDEIKVLISKDVLSEGCDIPKARVAMFAAFTESISKFVQRAGRVLRPYTYPDGTNKTDCLILDQMNLLRRFGSLENLVIDESVLFPPVEREKGEMPLKQCPECNLYNWISAPICVGLSKEDPGCGYEFEIVGTERHRPTSDLERWFPEVEQKMQFAFYQRQLISAWKEKRPPEDADMKFLRRFHKFAPHDWKRQSVLTKGTEEEKQLYKNYLMTIAQSKKRSHHWVEGQLALQLGTLYD